jgi:hypothetical protein
VYKRIAIVSAAIVVSPSAVACGTETTTATPATTPPRPGVGDKLEIDGDHAKLAVTLTKTKRLPAIRRIARASQSAFKHASRCGQSSPRPHHKGYWAASP